MLQWLPKLIGDSWVVGAGVNFFWPSDAHFFLVRPMGVGLIITAWILLVYDPILNSRIWQGTDLRKRLAWILGFWVLAIVLAISFALLFYWRDQSQGPLAQAGVTGFGISAIFALLLLSPLAGAGIGVCRSLVGPLQPWLALVVSAVGSIAVGLILLFKVDAALPPVLIFVLLHMATAIVTCITGLYLATIFRHDGGWTLRPRERPEASPQ